MKKLITYVSRAAMSLLILVMVFTAQTARAGYGWYDISMSIGGITTDPSTWSTNGNNPTDLGVVSDMTITSIAFNVWSDANDRSGANMFFRIWDGGSSQVGNDQDLHLGAATRINGKDHDFAISWTGSKDLAAAVGLTLVPGKTYYIDMWAKTYKSGGSEANDEWYSNGGTNYHAKFKYLTYDVTANPGTADNEYWSTYYNELANVQMPSGTKVFKVTLTGTTLKLTEITDGIVNKGEGVVLKSNSASITLTYAASGTTDEGGYSNNSLVGTMTSITNPGNAFVLNKDTNGVGFYKLSSGANIGANKAYLTYDGTFARQFFLFDEATGISATLNDNVETANDNCYDLQGRRVAQPTKGMYIVNGKKVIK